MDTTPESTTAPLGATGADAPEVAAGTATTPTATSGTSAAPTGGGAAQTTVLPAAGPATVTKPTGRPLRMSTVVWGVIITVIGVGIVARGLGADFDNQLAFIILLVAAGAALVLTSIYSAVRRR